MRGLITLLLFASPAFAGWSACYKLQGNGLGTTNFPIILSTANNAQMASILGKFAATPSGLVTSPLGYDIIVSTDPGCNVANKVPFERVVRNASIVELAYLGTTNATYYLGIGNSAITTDQSDPATLWNTAGAQRVWHTPDGTSLTSPSPESTSNADNAVLHGSPSPTAGASPTGGAAILNGTSQYLSFTGLTFSQPFTVIASINTTSVAADSSFVGGGNGALGFRVSAGGHPYVTRTNAADDSQSTATLSTNVWYRVAMVQDSVAHCTYYVNGVAAGSFNSCQTAFASNTNTIGAGFTATRFFPGSIAEVYFMGANETANWIADDTASQQPSSTFVTVSSAAAPATFQPVIF